MKRTIREKHYLEEIYHYFCHFPATRCFLMRESNNYILVFAVRSHELLVHFQLISPGAAYLFDGFCCMYLLFYYLLSSPFFQYYLHVSRGIIVNSTKNESVFNIRAPWQWLEAAHGKRLLCMI